MQRAEKEIPIIDVVNITIISIRPVRRPGVCKFEPISAVLKTGPIFNQNDALDAEVAYLNERLF